MPKVKLPSFLNLKAALKEFATITNTQSQEHIKPIHRHLAMRLVLEGGFNPDEIMPHPPLAVERAGKRNILHFDPKCEAGGEQTVLGGLKSKAVDVVVTKPGVGPVMAISVKGTIGAFRNLTNRMEEAIGDSANIHIMYPGLVYGFLHLLNGNDARKAMLKPNDIAINHKGAVVPSILRYHDVLLGLTGRRFVRNDVSRYEAVGLGLVNPHDEVGALNESFPVNDSPLHISRFIAGVLATYDLRFPYVASTVTILKRYVWETDSPALVALRSHGACQRLLGYEPREGVAEAEDKDAEDSE
jgi:hypothetical protein